MIWLKQSCRNAKDAHFYIFKALPPDKAVGHCHYSLIYALAVAHKSMTPNKIFIWMK